MKKLGIIAILIAAAVALTGCNFESMRSIEVKNKADDNAVIESIRMADETGKVLIDNEEFEVQIGEFLGQPIIQKGIAYGKSCEAYYYGSGKVLVQLTLDNGKVIPVNLDIPEDPTFIVEITLRGSNSTSYVIDHNIPAQETPAE